MMCFENSNKVCHQFPWQLLKSVATKLIAASASCQQGLWGKREEAVRVTQKTTRLKHLRILVFLCHTKYSLLGEPLSGSIIDQETVIHKVCKEMINWLLLALIHGQFLSYEILNSIQFQCRLPKEFFWIWKRRKKEKKKERRGHQDNLEYHKSLCIY